MNPEAPTPDASLCYRPIQEPHPYLQFRGTWNGEGRFDFARCLETFEAGLDVSLAFDHSELLALTEKLYAAIPVEVKAVENQPYQNVHDMAARVSKEGVMYISRLHVPCCWSMETTIKTRAVHDWYAHIVPYNDFSWEGEVKAFQSSLAHYPEHLHWLLYSEVVLQVPQLITRGNVEQKIVYCRGDEPLRTYESWLKTQGYTRQTEATRRAYRDYAHDFVKGSEIAFSLTL